MAITMQSNEEDYIVRNKKEVTQILNGLLDNKTPLKISFNQDKEEYRTPIVSIDTQNNAVYFDMSLDKAFNKRLLASESISILKDTGIKIKWQAELHTLTTLADGNALRVQLPEAMIRLQRRALFRLPIPMTIPVTCTLQVPNVITPSKNDTVKVEVLDISLGGICLHASNGVHPGIKVGAVFKNAKVFLPEIGETEITLAVRNIIPITQAKTKQKYRIGFEFVNPSRASEAVIHKYTFDLERSMLAARTSMLE